MKKVLVVGGGVQHASAIQILKQYGYYVVLADYTPNPKGKQFADKHIQENAFNVSILEQLVVKENIDIIFNICFDLAMPSVAYVSEKLGLPIPYNYEQALNNTDKMRMKDIFIKNGILTANYCVVDETLQITQRLNYPIVVKPADSSGSRGIFKVCSEQKRDIAIQQALLQSNSHKVILEEFIAGKEYQVDCIVKGGKLSVVLAKQKLRFIDEDVVSPAGSLILPDDKNPLYQRQKELASQLASAFCISNGVFFYQCLEKDGNLYVIEIGVRIGGGLGYKMIRDIKGVDFVKMAVDSWLGRELQYTISPNNEYFLSNAIFSSQPGVIKGVQGFEKLASSNVVDNYDIYINDGKVVDGRISNKNRLALYLTHASSVKELQEKYQKIIDGVEIVEESGKQCFDNSLYLSLKQKFN